VELLLSLMIRILTLRLLIKDEPQQMSYAKLRNRDVGFRTPVANVGDVYLANSYASANDAGMRYSIPAGSHESMKVTNLDELWYYGTLGDYLYIMTEIDE